MKVIKWSGATTQILPLIFKSKDNIQGFEVTISLTSNLSSNAVYNIM